MAGQNPYLLILPFLLMGLAIFAILLTAVYLMLWPYRRETLPPEPRETEPNNPPDNLSPAEAGCLASPGCRVSWSQAFGCLLDLAAEGFVSVQCYNLSKSQGAGEAYRLGLIRNPDTREPFERALLEVAFVGEAGEEGGVTLEQFASRYTARAHRFKGPLLQALRRKALLDPAREDTLKYLRRLSLTAALMGVFCLATGLWVVPFPGRWASLPIAAGFLAGGLVAYLQAGSFTICTVLGRQSAGRWSGFAAGLALAGLPQAFENAREQRQLGYLAALDQLGTWMGRLQPDSLASPPAWFETSLGEDRARWSFLQFLAAVADLSGERPASLEDRLHSG